MKNYETILAELGIEIPDDKKGALKTAMAENYRTIVDYNKQVEANTSLNASLEDVTGKLNAFKDVNVEELKGQIASLTSDLEAEKDGRKKESVLFTIKSDVNTYLASKKFVNAITRDHIAEKMVDALTNNELGKSKDEIFKGLTENADGTPIEGILVSESDPKKPRFTGKDGNGGGNFDDLSKMSLDERMKLKRENPELYNKLRQMM